MISLLILALGLLGMTALQNEALRFNLAAFTESQAQFLIDDMLERIRANPASNLYSISFDEAASSPPVDCASSSCRPEQLASWDIAQWRASVQGATLLSQGESEIRFDPLTRELTVSISYDWSQLGGSDAGERRHTLSVRSRVGD